MIDPPQLLLFVLLTAVAVTASLHSFRTRQVYGIFRFIAFEALILLIVCNTSRWFREPLSTHQIFSWVLFMASIVLAIHVFYFLHAVGRAQKRIIEDTQTLLEVGVYRYIRHPAYASLILFGWGVFLKGLDLPSGALAAVATVFIFTTAKCEEDLNIDHFGAAYSEYMKRTKMFIPFLL